MNFYELATKLRYFEIFSEDVPNTYINLKIDFFHVIDRIKNNTKDELKIEEELTNNNVLSYWAEFIQCFLKITINPEFDEFDVFRAEKHAFVTITQIYGRDVYEKNLNKHYKKWKVESISKQHI